MAGFVLERFYADGTPGDIVGPYDTYEEAKADGKRIFGEHYVFMKDVLERNGARCYTVVGLASPGRA